jgi:hypothetical protein
MAGARAEPLGDEQGDDEAEQDAEDHELAVAPEPTATLPARFSRCVQVDAGHAAARRLSFSRANGWRAAVHTYSPGYEHRDRSSPLVRRSFASEPRNTRGTRDCFGLVEPLFHCRPAVLAVM